MLFAIAEQDTGRCAANDAVALRREYRSETQLTPLFGFLGIGDKAAIGIHLRLDGLVPVVSTLGIRQQLRVFEISLRTLQFGLTVIGNQFDQ